MFLTLLLLPMAPAAEDILFIGNSYTTSNNLPLRVAEVFEAAGRSATTSRLAAGGLTLADHAARASSSGSGWHNKLVVEADQRQWVVLQDQSQIPGFPSTQPERIASVEGAVYLNSLVADAEAETMLFLTWGYRDGDAHNDWLFPDFSTMLELISAGYIDYAEACATDDRPVWIAPVGHAFAGIHKSVSDSGIDPTGSGTLFHSLYSADGSHPSGLGTQLAAYVFFTSITGESPVGLPPPVGIEPTLATTLQQAAADAVFSSADAFDFPWESTGEPEGRSDGSDDTGADTGASPEDPGDLDGDSSSAEDDPPSSAAGDADPDRSRSKNSGGCGAAPLLPTQSSTFPLCLFVLLFCSRRREN